MQHRRGLNAQMTGQFIGQKVIKKSRDKKALASSSQIESIALIPEQKNVAVNWKPMITISKGKKS